MKTGTFSIRGQVTVEEGDDYDDIETVMESLSQYGDFEITDKMEIFTITSQLAGEEINHLQPQPTLRQALEVCQKFQDELNEGVHTPIVWDVTNPEWVESVNWDDLGVEYKIAKWAI